MQNLMQLLQQYGGGAGTLNVLNVEYSILKAMHNIHRYDQFKIPVQHNSKEIRTLIIPQRGNSLIRAATV